MGAETATARRYRRVALAAARKPKPGMRLVGRKGKRPRSLVEIESVTTHYVMFSRFQMHSKRRKRQGTRRRFHLTMSRAEYAAAIRTETLIGVWVPVEGSVQP